MIKNKSYSYNFLIIMLLVILIVVSPIFVEAEVIGDYDYEFINEDTEAVITDYFGTGGDIIIPSNIEGKPVVGIKSGGFFSNGVFYNKNITSVILPETLEFIGYYAFGNNQISNLTIPSSVISIEGGAFEGNRLNSLIIPGGINTIESYAFAANQLTSIIINEGVSRIEPYAFSENQLTSISIPSSVNYISGFSYNQLDEVIIPEGISTIGVSAFQNNKIANISIPSSVTTIEDSAFSVNKLTNITIPDGVKSISKSAFSNNHLTNIEIPEGVIDIGDSAFGGNLLKSVTIPKSVSTIGESAFKSNQITILTIPEGVTTIGNGAFDDNDISSVIIEGDFIISGYGQMGLFKRNEPMSVIFTNGVTTIPHYIFGYNKVTSVLISDSITSIGRDAFRSSGLTQITIPDSVVSIENEAFVYNNLFSVRLPSSVKSIGSDVFKGNQPNPRDFIIYGEPGSRAETYANTFEHTFLPLDSTPVLSIAVTGQGNNTIIETTNGNLQMIATVLPEDATIKDIKWSVVPGTGRATIDQNGLLTAVKNGTVTVVATARDGSGVSGNIDVTIGVQSEFINWEPKFDVELNKTWTIGFNKILDIDTIKQKNIYVTDIYDRIIPMLYYQRQQDVDKSIYIVPVQDYESGETYILWIKDLKAEDGSILNKNVKMEFTIK